MSAEHRDIADIRTILSKRRDIFLHAKHLTAPDGTAPIIGTQLQRVTETEVRGKDSYHPFNYVGWMYYGQSFAIDRIVRGKINKDQQDWKENFEAVGGLYIQASDMRDVLKLLGDEPEDVQNYLARAPMKRF